MPVDERPATVPHIGPRCSYCGVRAVTKGNAQWVPEEPHSTRCAVTKHGSSPMWEEWPEDIKAERDALRRRVAELEAALERIADHPKWYAEDGTTADCDQSCMNEVMGIAQDALKGQSVDS